jgi:hypothetical protein
VSFLKLPEYKEGIERLTAPKTLEGLKQWLGPLGEAVVEQAEWGAVLGWLNRRERDPDPERTRRVALAVRLYMEAKRAMADIPSITGQPTQAEYLEFHRSRQSRIKKTALEQLAAWRSAGQPRLDNSIAYTAEYMRTALRKAGREVPQP